jgi:hypothetical protein
VSQHLVGIQFIHYNVLGVYLQLPGEAQISDNSVVPFIAGYMQGCYSILHGDNIAAMLLHCSAIIIPCF